MMIGEAFAEEKISAVQDEDIRNIYPIREGVNKSYKAETKSNSFFIKFGTQAGTRIETEYKVYNILYEKNGIPVPKPIHFDIDKNTPYIITSWIEGEDKDANISEISNANIARSMGEILGKIHKITINPGPILLNENKNIEWEKFYKKWLKYNAEDVKKNYSSIGSKIMACVHNMEIPEAHRTCISPMDYHLQNCISRNEEVIAIIDFERSYGGDPRWSYEVSKRLFALYDVKENFVSGYTAIHDRQSEAIFELAALCRELRMAHMLFESPESRREIYIRDIENIKSRLFDQE
jgi:aminoglycoside phosphotransferase (APT) family kinase protein